LPVQSYSSQKQASSNRERGCRWVWERVIRSQNTGCRWPTSRITLC